MGTGGCDEQLEIYLSGLESIKLIMTTTISHESILRDYITASERGQPYTWFNYQPINLPGFEATLPLAGRDCFDRSQAIAQTIEDTFQSERIKIIDWGCNLGFFAFELAARGHDVVGIDADRRVIDVCRYLARSSNLTHPPRFYCDRLDETSVNLYGEFDVAICLSVLHHLHDNRKQVIADFSRLFPRAFIEMDGRNFGCHELSSFYWDIREIVECHDRYGAGTRQRKTWFCNNEATGSQYTNLKRQNIIGGRGVFLREQTGRQSVLKRESVGSSHTWIRTNLQHELEMYQTWEACPFFARLLDHGRDERNQWIECEFVEDDGSANIESLNAFFAFLEANGLFVLDISVDSFLFQEGQLRFVDLESLFCVSTTIRDLVKQRTSRDTIALDSYEKQLTYITRRLKL
jgi:SAM-dependent methyltransferase